MAKKDRICTAKVTMTAEHVGAELEEFLEATWDLDFPALDDFVVHENGSAWRFEGHVTSSHDYTFITGGLFLFDGKLLDVPARILREKLYDAILQRQGAIDLAWTETRQGSPWASSRQAHIGVTSDAERIELQNRRLTDWLYWDLDALTEIYNCEFFEALEKHLGLQVLSDLAAAWGKANPDQRLSKSGAEDLLRNGYLTAAKLEPKLNRAVEPQEAVRPEHLKCSICRQQSAGKQTKAGAWPIPLVRFGRKPVCPNCLSLHVPEKTYQRLVTNQALRIQ